MQVEAPWSGAAIRRGESKERSFFTRRQKGVRPPSLLERRVLQKQNQSQQEGVGGEKQSDVPAWGQVGNPAPGRGAENPRGRATRTDARWPAGRDEAACWPPPGCELSM